MPDLLALSGADRQEALAAAADALGRPPHLLEKDVLVVWALRHLFSGPHAAHLVFKGGTSLSKAHAVIQRFSEDVDLTYDIRAIAPDLVGEAGSALPRSRSQSKTWTREINARLARLIANEIQPQLATALHDAGVPATARQDHEHPDRVYIEYEPAFSGTGYTPPAVLLEFGARSTGEPSTVHHIVCDAAAANLPGVEFPEADATCMTAERTFWEKATAVHVYCLTGRFRGGPRFARHWYDLTRLDLAGYADKAFADQDLARAVADHKSLFFTEPGVDYHAAIGTGLRLVPDADAIDALHKDYESMTMAGMFVGEADAFDTLMAQCAALEAKAKLTT